MSGSIKIYAIAEKVENLTQLVRNSNLIPVLGSGFSAGLQTSKGGIVPSGSMMKKEMIKSLTDNGYSSDSSKPFSRIAMHYNNLIPAHKRKEYIANNFINVRISYEKKQLINMNWPYIYTLNIDDAIERNSDYVPLGPNVPIEKMDYGIKPVYKLHGNAKDIVYLKDGEDFSIFDTNQYMDSLDKNKWLLNKLKQDYIDKNILFIGCSLDDEIDLMHVFSRVKQSNSPVQTEKFFVTDKRKWDKTELIDLEAYGITSVLIVDNYDQLYDLFAEIKQNSRCIKSDELERFKNIPYNILNNRNDCNKDYILFGKNPYDKKSNKISLPNYFIARDITEKILKEKAEHPIQIIYGKRISGKSYVLLDIRSKIADRDVYYFDSREGINQELLAKIINRKNSVFLIDTNVLTDDAFASLLQTDCSVLKKQCLNIIVCANSSSKYTAIELHGAKNNRDICIYDLDNRFSLREYKELKNKLIAINIPFFQKDLTIIDSILWIQEKLSKNNTTFSLKNFYIDPKDYLQMALLIILAYKEKLDTSDLIRYNLFDESVQLRPRIEIAVEADYGRIITRDFLDSSRYQIVCNAKIWLLGYLSRISLRSTYLETFKKAIVYIVKQMKETAICQRTALKEIFDFILFDNINYLLGGARTKDFPVGARKIIQTSYLDLKSLLCDQYQFNHQYAKCLLWGIENQEDRIRINELNEALQSAIIAQQLIDELHNQNNTFLKISYAHIQFTISMIRVKLFFFDENENTFKNAVLQLSKTLQYPQNLNAFELYDDFTEDNSDYSVSKFMDYLLDDKSKKYQDGLKREIEQIINCRFRCLKEV